MRLLPRWWRRHFLGAELALAVAISAAVAVWAERYDGAAVVALVLDKQRATIYGALASVFGSLLGFIITTVSVVIAFATHDRLALVRQSEHYPTLWKTFISATKVLGLATVGAFVALLVDRDNSPRRSLLYLVLFLALLAILRIARSVWVLERVVELVAKKDD